MQIAHRKIGPEWPPLVIAEIGINHGGDLEVAKQMVKSAALSGCECVKHQTHFLEDEMTDEARSIVPPNDHRSIWEIMEACCLSQDEEVELKKYAEDLGLIYISTPFSRKAADFLFEIGVPAFKIGSGECDNPLLIQHIAKFNLPIIMSTGMQTISSLRPGVEVLSKSGVDYALLECTNLYPSPPEIVSLSGIQELREAFPDAVVGFSDHSVGPYMALAAAGLGASIIERHFTDSRYRQGPDISCSMDPAELRLLVDRSREIFIALNTPKSRSSQEQDVYNFARSSLVAERDLSAGHVLEIKDLWARRPGSGDIAGYDYQKVLGRRLVRSVPRNHQISFSDFE